MRREYSAQSKLFLLVTPRADRGGTLETLQARSVVHFDQFFSQEPPCRFGGRECDAFQLMLVQSACRMADKAACSKPVRLRWE